MEYLAKDIYPQAFGDLNPDETYHYIVRHFTDLPDQPFVFSTAAERVNIACV